MEQSNIITRILKRKKNSNCLLFIDNEYFMDFSLDLIMKYKLSKGMIFDDEIKTKIVSEQRIINVKQTAYNFASYKPRTIQQVLKKLKEKKFNQSEFDIAIDFLSNFNLLDDEKFATTFAKEYIQRKKCGEQKILLELINRGINKNLAIKVVKNVFQQDEKEDLALLSAEKKMRLLKSKPIEKQKELLKNHLQRNGFDWSTIKIIINKIFTEN